MLTIIGIIATVAFISGTIAGIILFKNKINKLKTTRYDRSEINDIDNTQDLLPFSDISKNRIHLGNNRYVAILKVEPFNYMNRSEDGKDAFALNLRRAYNSMNYKTYIFTHTQNMVNDNMLKNLEKTIDTTVSEYPEQKDYADEYFKHLSIINVQNLETGALRKIKKHYIIVPWEPSEEHNGMSKEELNFTSNEDLRYRLQNVSEKFKSCGISTNFLSTMEIISLLTSVYRREESNRADLVFSKEYLSAMVSGDIDSLNVEDSIKLSSILEGAINQINDDILSNTGLDENVRKRGLKSVNILTTMLNKMKNQ